MLLPTPTPCLRSETHRKPAYHSSPIGTASTNWSHPTGDSHSEGTRGERRKQRTKSKHGTGTIPCTPVGTVLHDRRNTSSIIGADICVYSIVGAVGLPYDKKPPTCLWASVVLWAPGFTIHGTRGRAPHIPNSILQVPTSTLPKEANATSHVHLTFYSDTNSIVGAYHHRYPRRRGQQGLETSVLSPSHL